MLRGIYQKLLPLRVRRVISQRLKTPLNLIHYYRYDLRRFQHFSAVSGKWDRENRIARITALYHVLEKGLSFRDTRLFFGRDKVVELIDELRAFSKIEEYECEVQWHSAVRVLNEYLEYHDAVIGDETSDPFLDTLRDALSEFEGMNPMPASVGGGYIECTRSDIHTRGRGAFPEMALSRYSIRHFSGEAVPANVIEQAVQWAQKSPSVCNRQSARVHAVRGRTLINSILSLHGGARGFAEQVDTLLIVTGSLRIFLGAVERNQVYLDTGIFTMSLLYGLHYLGVGGCPLHWCVDPAKDLALRRLAGIHEGETISTLIAVGSLPEKFKVAHSQRLLTEDVLTWVEPS